MLRFYAEAPKDLMGTKWKGEIDRVTAKAFGATDSALWLADKVLFMAYRGACVGVASLDLFDYSIDRKGERLWLESLAIPPHPLKSRVSLFEEMWTFIEEEAASVFPKHTSISLLVDQGSPFYGRLVNLYKRKGFEVERKDLSIEPLVYTLMRTL